VDDERAGFVIELAKEFMEFLRRTDSSWKKGYYRFHSEPFQFGSSASWVTDGGKVTLVNAVKNGGFYVSMDKKGRQLLKLLGKDTGVFVLIIDASFDYKIDFEYEDLSRWRISKLNGGTGISVGL
jgi:hypothetical protein